MSCAAIKRNKVVLPQPDGPMMAVTLPRGMTISTFLKMLRSPRWKVTPFSSTALAWVLAALIWSPYVRLKACLVRDAPRQIATDPTDESQQDWDTSVCDRFRGRTIPFAIMSCPTGNQYNEISQRKF